ncbi:hypothetical protein CDL12_12343 [Handroanthus impetiginosus]|uniref:Uncharacterized protein n=1 Tax=Handroanthus impetiginosus TaxID=429701 RepID=A0A2G9HBU3_9LAMI|nr:hypothetical protein CDL12_12343 [Handroanthus impetiginosus]
MLSLSAGSSYTIPSTRWFPLSKIASTLQFIVRRLHMMPCTFPAMSRERNDGTSVRFIEQIGGNVFLHRIQQSDRESFIPCKRWTQVILFLKSQIKKHWQHPYTAIKLTEFLPLLR